MCNKNRKITEFDSIIGGNLKALRMRHNVTQQTLAKELDMTFQQIQKYEKGYNRMSASTLYKVAKFLNEPVDSFFYNDAEGQTGSNGNTPVFNKEFFELFDLYCKISDRKTQKELVRLLKTLANSFET